MAHCYLTAPLYKRSNFPNLSSLLTKHSFLTVHPSKQQTILIVMADMTSPYRLSVTVWNKYYLHSSVTSLLWKLLHTLEIMLTLPTQAKKT